MGQPIIWVGNKTILGVNIMNRDRRPTTLAAVIVWWVVAIGAVAFDFLVLVPRDELTWWQIGITLFLIGSAIHTTFRYRKEQAEGFEGTGENEN